MTDAYLLLSQYEAWRILRWFWPHRCPALSSIGPADRSFAQQILAIAVERSLDIGYIQSRFRTIHLRRSPGTDAERRQIDLIARRFLQKAPAQWVRLPSRSRSREPEIQESVRSAIAVEFYPEMGRLTGRTA